MSKLSQMLLDRMYEHKAKILQETDFSDLTPLEDSEVDTFWPFRGSAFERTLVLRLARRSAEEFLKALIFRRAGLDRPCYKCGEHLALCECRKLVF